MGAYSVQDVINYATNEADFYVALLNVAQMRGNARVSNDRLGRWLKKIEGQIISGLMLNQAGSKGGYLLWSLMEI